MTRARRAGRLAAYGGVTVAAVIGTLAIQRRTDQRIEQAQIRACERGNVLRAQLTIHADAIRELLDDRAAANQAVKPAASAQYRKAAAALSAFPPVDCVAVIERPNETHTATATERTDP